MQYHRCMSKTFLSAPIICGSAALHGTTHLSTFVKISVSLTQFLLASAINIALLCNFDVLMSDFKKN